MVKAKMWNCPFSSEHHLCHILSKKYPRPGSISSDGPVNKTLITVQGKSVANFLVFIPFKLEKQMSSYIQQ